MFDFEKKSSQLHDDKIKWDEIFEDIWQQYISETTHLSALKKQNI